MTSHETPAEQARRVADSLRASGLGRAVEAAAGRGPAQVRLVPDLADELTGRLAWLSEVLTGWDTADLVDGEEFEDPAEAAAAAAAEDAVDRILAAIRPTQTDPRTPSEVRVDGQWVPQSTAPAGYAGRLLAPGGTFEFAPARLVDVDQDDINAVVDICERIIDRRGPLADVADEVATTWADHTDPDAHVDSAPWARRVLGVMAVLERTPWADENVEALAAALTGHDPDTDLILTVDQAAAYQAWTTATNTDLGGGGLDRFARAGFSY